MSVSAFALTFYLLRNATVLSLPVVENASLEIRPRGRGVLSLRVAVSYGKTWRQHLTRYWTYIDWGVSCASYVPAWDITHTVMGAQQLVLEYLVYHAPYTTLARNLCPVCALT